MSAPAETLLSCLDGVRRTGDGRWAAKCPSHPDRQASLSIRELDDGRVLAHCFAGCSIQEVLGAVGLSLTDLFPKAAGHHYSPESRPFPAADVVRVMSSEAMVAATVLARAIEGTPLTDDQKQRGALAAWRLVQAHDIALPTRDRRRQYREAARLADGQCG